MKNIKEEPLESQCTAVVHTAIPSLCTKPEIQSQTLPSRFMVGSDYEKFFSDLISLESDFVKDCSNDWMSTSYDRQEAAVKSFSSRTSEDNLLFQQLLGSYVEEGLHESKDFKIHSVPSLPALDSHQVRAVDVALNNRITLIQGQTGSGKSVTLLSILYHLVQKQKGPILVCAHTNNVVDQLALSIHKMNIKIVRLFAQTRSADGTPIKFLGLESQIRNKAMMTERHVLDDADVICCTCIAAGDERLSSMKFHAILIDESMQATEPECIIPIALGCERLVLVGDPLQLLPITQHNTKKFTGTRLGDSYRIFRAEFNDERRLPNQAVPWVNADFPCVFYDVNGTENRLNGFDFKNVAESVTVQHLISRMIQNGISAERIGIITQFAGQKSHLLETMKKSGLLIEVNKPDAYQGREKDVIFISCVRSDGTYGLGSLGYKQRFLLALTRARFGIVIVGNSKALLLNDMWKNLLDFYKEHGGWIKT